MRPTMEAAADMGSMTREYYLGTQGTLVAIIWTWKISSPLESESERKVNGDSERIESHDYRYTGTRLSRTRMKPQPYS